MDEEDGWSQNVFRLLEKQHAGHELAHAVETFDHPDAADIFRGMDLAQVPKDIFRKGSAQHQAAEQGGASPGPASKGKDSATPYCVGSRRSLAELDRATAPFEEEVSQVLRAWRRELSDCYNVNLPTALSRCVVE